MKYLTRLLKNLSQQIDFKFHPRCQKQQLNQLSFADDSLLFSRGDINLVRRLFDCFQEFFKVSGLVANQTKNNIYFGRVIEADQQAILQYTGFKKGTLSFKYLGVSLSSKKLSINQCQPLLDKMLGSIQNWTVKFLSYASRLQLDQSVLLAIQNFLSQVFCLPKKVLKQVETVCKRFLWNGEV